MNDKKIDWSILEVFVKLKKMKNKKKKLNNETKRRKKHLRKTV